jgi:hypothetical protein
MDREGERPDQHNHEDGGGDGPGAPPPPAGWLAGVAGSTALWSGMPGRAAVQITGSMSTRQSGS